MDFVAAGLGRQLSRTFLRVLQEHQGIVQVLDLVYSLGYRHTGSRQ